MTLVRTIRGLLLGETWVLPIGIACVVAACVAARALLGDAWRPAGGFVMLAGVATVLVVSVAESARDRRRRR